MSGVQTAQKIIEVVGGDGRMMISLVFPGFTGGDVEG